MTNLSQRRLRVAIAAGGTGGHIYPGIAVADALRDLTGGNCEIYFFGVPGRLEEKIVPQHGYPLHTHRMIGARGLAAGLLPAVLARSAWQCARLLRRLGIDVVVGMGGYPSMPAVIGATLARLPVLVHESNAVPGRANLLAARIGAQVAVVFPSVAPGFPQRSRARHSGMPLLAQIATLDRGALRDLARHTFGLAPDQRLVVVNGGSLGARSLTQAAIGLADRWRGRDDVRLVVKTGPQDLARARERLAGNPVADAVDYLPRMDLVYAAADVMVCRAGASTIAELARVGMPSVLVPYPHAPGGHQLGNANALGRLGAAVVVPDAAVSGELLAARLAGLLSHPGQLALMGAAARLLDRPDAARVVAARACELAGYQPLAGQRTGPGEADDSRERPVASRAGGGAR